MTSKKRCSHCNSLKTIKKGSGASGQRYYCKDCSRRFRLRKYNKEA